MYKQIFLYHQMSVRIIIWNISWHCLKISIDHQNSTYFAIICIQVNNSAEPAYLDLIACNSHEGITTNRCMYMHLVFPKFKNAKHRNKSYLFFNTITTISWYENQLNRSRSILICYKKKNSYVSKEGHYTTSWNSF